MKKAITILALGLMMACSLPMTVVAAKGAATEVSVQDTPVVKVHPGGVVIEIAGEQAQHVVIYALTGQVIKQCDVAPGETNIELPAGYYIVRIGHTTVKVAVK